MFSKKIKVLLILLLPILGWSQPTNFTQKQIEIVRDFYEEMENETEEEFASRVEEVLEKVPYHPKLVQSFLKVKLYRDSDTKFIYNYCKDLDDRYLFSFQPILVEHCACAYYYEKDINGLYFRIIPLIEDMDAKELYLTSYYLLKENKDTFKVFAESSLSKTYEYYGQNLVRDNLLGYFYALFINDLYFSKKAKFIENYEHIIFSSELDVIIYSELISASVYNKDYELVERLMNHVKEVYIDGFKYLYPVKALYHAKKGEDDLVIEALENAFDIEKSDFNFIFHERILKRNIFDLYSMSIMELENYKTKQRLVNKGIEYFENRNDYKIKFKLYQSLLHASKSLKKARSVLEECKPYLKEQNLNDLERMIRIENELGKKTPDYRLVNSLIGEVLDNYSSTDIDFQRILFQYKVNYNTKKTVFSIEETVKQLDNLLEKPLDINTRLKYLQFKIVLIGENDREWALREIEKLPSDLTKEIISDFGLTENNSQMASELLISNRKELKDINKSINLIITVYINELELKE